MVEIRRDALVLAYNLPDASVTLFTNDNEDTADAQAIRNDLRRDVFAVVDRQGKVLSLRFDAATSQISRNFARTLIAATQFVFLPQQRACLNQWETQEEDANGGYVAHYRCLNKACSTAGAASFQKQITNYLPNAEKASGTEFNVEFVIMPAGALTATVDQGSRRVLSLAGTQSQTFQVAGKTVGHTQTSIGLKFIGGDSVAPVRLAALRTAHARLKQSVAAVTLSAPTSKRESEVSIERSELGTDSLEQLRTELAALDSAPAEQNETRIYLKFKALVYLHPDESQALGQLLSTANAKSITMRVLTGALSVVGSPEAQAALVSAIKARSEDWPALSMLIPALNEVSLPTALAEEAIRELAYKSPDPAIASTAQLTLGTMARRLVGSSPGRADEIVDFLTQQIATSPSLDTTRQLLLALGNAGSVRASAAILKFTADSSPVLRAASASALRWIDSDQARKQLLVMLASEPDSSVRFEAAVALSFRDLTVDSFAAQKQALLAEEDSKVRLALLRNLWQGHLNFPEVRGLTEKVAASDSSQDVRKTATQLLATEPSH